MKKLIDGIKSYWFTLMTPMVEQVDLALREKDSPSKFAILNALGTEMNEDVATFPSFANTYADSMIKVAAILVEQKPYVKTALVSYFRLASSQYTSDKFRNQAVALLIEHGEKAPLEDRLKIYYIASSSAQAGSDLHNRSKEMIRKYTDLKAGRTAPS